MQTSFVTLAILAMAAQFAAVTPKPINNNGVNSGTSSESVSSGSTSITSAGLAPTKNDIISALKALKIQPTTANIEAMSRASMTGDLQDLLDGLTGPNAETDTPADKTTPQIQQQVNAAMPPSGQTYKPRPIPGLSQDPGRG